MLLEGLLIEHVIEPFKAVNSHQVDPSDKFAQTLSASFHSFHFHLPLRSHRAMNKAQTYVKWGCLSLLFNIALSRGSSNQRPLRRADSAWLEALFLQIQACATAVVTSESLQRRRREVARLTKWLLELAAEHKLTLSIPCLRGILEKHSSLFDKGSKDDPDWGIISHCLKNDSSVFLHPSTTHGTALPGSFTTKSPSLAALLAKITEASCNLKLVKDDDCDFKISHILIPLLHAFAETRNLGSFITHWKEQLEVVQQRRQRTGQPDHPTIWEDETLARAVGELLGSKATIGQMESVLNDAGQAIQNLQSTNDESLSSLILIECIFSSCRGEKLITGLAKSAATVVQAIARILRESPHLLKRGQSRAWRAVSVFNERLTAGPGDQDLAKDVMDLIKTAQDILDESLIRPSNNTVYHYTNVLQAFTFLLSFASMHVEIPSISPQQIVVQAIEQILKLKEKDCKSLQDKWYGGKQEEVGPSWTYRNHEVKSLHELYLACVSQIIMSKPVIGYDHFSR